MLVRAGIETKAQVRVALQRASDRGRDPVAALDDLGLLWSPEKQKQVTADAALMLAGLLAQLTVRQLTPPGDRVAQTPLDTKRAIEMWLRQMGEGSNVGQQGRVA